MIYFTSDMHFGDERLTLFSRELVASSVDEMDNIIIQNWNDKIKNDDTVYVLGDCALSEDGLEKIEQLNGIKILIRGNYDQQFDTKKLEQYFNEIYDELVIEIDGEKVYLNHYPTNGKKEYFNIVGHIHGIWKVQRNMINVGVDAWHFYPVSEDIIKFQMNGIRNYYDTNVFAGELDANNIEINNIDGHKYRLNWILKTQVRQGVQHHYYWVTKNDVYLKIIGEFGKKFDIEFKSPTGIENYNLLQHEIEDKFKVKLI